MTEKVLYAMRLAVEFERMKRFCDNRTTCKGCPYWKLKACNLISTDTVMEKVAIIFREFLEEQKKGEATLPLSVSDQGLSGIL